ncbi:MAG: response regulator [Bdellovibrionales bacterium]|nr:response regulator [Bdellovibrionales bacterium]
MNSKNVRFLVIDDVNVMTKLISQFLSEFGFSDILCAEDGRVAMNLLIQEYAAENPIDFVIADINMPNMNGIDLLKTCREDVRFHSLPILLLTSESEKSLVISAILLGVDDYLLKPFTKEDLHQKIKKALGKKTPQK